MVKFNFGKYKGQDHIEIANSGERGIGWLKWYCGTESKNDKYKEQNDKDKQEVRQFLGALGTTIYNAPSNIIPSSQPVINDNSKDILDILKSLDLKVDILIARRGNNNIETETRVINEADVPWTE